MGASIDDIRSAIAEALRPIDGLRVSTRYRGQINSPQAIVRRRSSRFGADFDGNADHEFAVSIYVALTDKEVAQRLIDGYLSSSGASSICAALMAAGPTLGGVVDFAMPTGAEEEGISSIDTIDYLVGTVTIQVGA